MPLTAPTPLPTENLADADAEARAADAIADAAPLTFRLFETLEAAEPAWRALEARGVLTSYQRFDWVRNFVGSHGLRGGRVAIAALMDQHRAVALLPLIVTSRLGTRSARMIGWQIGNADWLALDPAFAHRLDKPEMAQFLGDIAAATGADILALHSQAERWGGIENPLLGFPHQPSPDHFYTAPLGTDRLNAKRIRNIERGRRRLEESFGPVRLRRATTPEEVALFHAEFLRQRGLRFDEMGIGNVFAEPWFQAFFRNACADGLLDANPVLAIDALYAGDSIVATSIGSYCGTHYSQYINSTTDGPAAKYSLMGILMHDLVAVLRADGIVTLDMGLGDFEYKLDWTDKQVAWDAVLPLSLKGQLAARVLLGARALKRAIKQHDRVWTLVRKVRAALHRAR